ncbi:MAG TPA: hypothetical protein VIX86_23385 [Streptosporangiaceae bacterium]
MSAEVTARRVRLATTVLGALVLVLFGLSVPIVIAARKPIDGLALFGVVAAALGWLITRRQPGNRIGLLLAGFGALLAFYEDAARYAVADYHLHHGTLPLGFPAALIASELWSALFLMPPLIILLFADGTLPPRWRVVCRAYLVVCALIIAILLGAGAWQMSGTRIVVTSKGQFVNNSGPGGTLGWVLLIAYLAVPVSWALFVARQVLSWRRATGERRAQLKWLMAGSMATVIGLAGGFLLQSLTVLDNICVAVGIFSLPVCISFAILKYHLYDIDRLISRTLSYTVVTGLLIGVYAGIVTFATRVLPITSPVGVAASTLVAAALFNPLRRRVQQVVDRRFNRARYDAGQIVAAFASRLKEEVDLDSIRDDLAGAVHQALEPGHVSVWINERG